MAARDRLRPAPLFEACLEDGPDALVWPKIGAARIAGPSCIFSTSETSALVKLSTSSLIPTQGEFARAPFIHLSDQRSSSQLRQKDDLRVYATLTIRTAVAHVTLARSFRASTSSHQEGAGRLLGVAAEFADIFRREDKVVAMHRREALGLAGYVMPDVTSLTKMHP